MAENIERTKEVMAMVARGFTQAQIGAHFRVSREMIKEIVRRERAKHPIDKQDAIADQVDILDQMIREAREIAEARPAPVTAGKDGMVVRDPEDGAIVRDHGARLAALALVRSLTERKAKLLGLDSASKTEVSGGITYTIESVNPSDIG